MDLRYDIFRYCQVLDHGLIVPCTAWKLRQAIYIDEVTRTVISSDVGPGSGEDQKTGWWITVRERPTALE